MKFYLAAAMGVSLVTANQKVMEIVNENLKKLRERGFFDRSLTRDSVLGSPQDCLDGTVTIEGESFPCENIDFLSFVSLKDLDNPEPAHRVGASSADIWGVLMPSGREFTVLALDNAVDVIDGTDPVNPCIVAKMPTRRVVDKWGDVKIYEHVLYHVKDTGVQDDDGPEGNAEYGIEVYDLKQLDQIDCHAEGYVPMNLFPQFVFSGHGRSHNVAINPESGLLYSTGSEKCAGGLVILDVKTNPMEPVQVGCAHQDGYTHDVQCLTYDGPDVRYTNSEICFAYNEDTLTIWNIDDPANPVIVSRTLYPNQVYSHQGWVNDDLTKVLLDDELDELCNENFQSHPRCDDFETTELSGEQHTTTNVFDITDLENPVFEGAYVHPDLAVDHNLYVWGSVHRRGHGGNPPMENPPLPFYAYMNNYVAGVKVVDIRSDDFTEWTQAGYFDIAPDLEGNDFAGAWSGYMHPSGVYAVSSIERGLFFLQPRMAFTDLNPPTSTPPTPTTTPAPPTPTTTPAPPTPTTTPAPPTPTTTPAPPTPTTTPAPPTDGNSQSEDDSKAGKVVLGVLMVALLLVMLSFTAYRQRQQHSRKQGEPLLESVAKSEANAPPKSTINPMHDPDFVEEP